MRRATISLAVVLFFAPLEPLAAADAHEQRPNILWITCEDISPNLGCYGDAYAVTPNLDRLAAQGVRYTNAFAPIGVCAPSRSCLITGMYPPSLGTQHMRCTGQLPDDVKCFPEYLRQVGYYCTNNVKTDYNFQHRPATWDESSAKAHWRNRKPGQPFFSVFNFTTCHESQIRLPEKAYQERTAQFTERERHDPAKAVLPPYHPDAPEVRKDWARYADMITYMDKQAGDILQQLEQDGLAEDTIVFFFSDHGAGMPRSKRWLYDSSLRVPFMVRFPKKYEALAPAKPGTTTDRLVSFVDFGPTVLSLAGVTVPAWMQGKPFLGSQAAEPRQYVYGFRDRMDERYDMIRAVRDRRYKYIRNYLPHLPYFHHQHLSYAWEMPTLRVWQTLAAQGKLTGPQAIFMAKSKPPEELYDCANDPWEINNLAASPEHQPILKRLRAVQDQWRKDIMDLSLLPEADMRTRFGGKPEYAAVRQNSALFPYERLAAAADLARQLDPQAAPQLIALFQDKDAAVRYWGAVGLAGLASVGKLPPDPKDVREVLRQALRDTAPWVRIAAADALCYLGNHDEALPILLKGMQHDHEWVRHQAVLVLDRIDERARPALEVIRQARKDKNAYVVRVVEHILQDLK